MANKVEIVVVAKNDTKATFAAVKAEATKVGKDSGDGLKKGIEDGLKGTKQSIEKNTLAPFASLISAQQRFATASAKAGDAAKKFGADSRQAADANLTLARAAIQVETSTKRVKDAFGELTPALKDMLKGAGLAEDQISSISKSFEGGFKNIAKVATEEGSKSGQGFMSSFASSIAGEGGGIAGVLGPVLIGAMATIAPFAGATLAAGIIGAAGTGGLVGGILIAAQDPRIVQGFSKLASDIGDALKIDANGLKQPILETLPIFRSAFQDVDKDIGAIFNKAQDWVKPLAETLANVTRSISSGLADLVNNGDSTMSALFAGIEQVGESLGNMFSLMSEDGPAAATALTAAFAIVSGAIDAVSVTIDGLAKAFGFLSDIGAFGPVLGTLFDSYNEQASNAQAETENVGRAFDGMKGSVEATRKEMQRMADDIRASTDPMFALMKAQEDASQKQKDFNKAVQKYGPLSQQASEASVLAGESAAKLSDASAKAAGTFNGKLSPALIATMKATGMSDALIATLGRTAETSQAKLDKMAKTYTVSVVTIFTQIGKPTAYTTLPSNTYKGLRTGGNVGAAASGGVQGNMTLVGEDGPELLSLPYGSTVHTAGQTRQMMSQSQAQRDPSNSGGSSDSWGNADAILNELREMRRALAQPANVYLDQRLVGSVQGKQANLFERAG